MLEIKNLHAKIGDKDILKGVNLTLEAGKVQAIMGPNGAGKSTLSKALAGHPDVDVTAGEIAFNGKDVLEMEVSERAVMGIFMGFQYPVEVPGVSNSYFLRTALNSIRATKGEDPIDAYDFLELIKAKAKQVGLLDGMLSRGVNVGFSGGEKKRNEILQMLVLDPSIMILDETDSGLDIDALQVVAEGINAMRSPEKATLLITHYQRLLDYVKPDVVHVMMGGKIVETGDASLALKLEENGYAWLNK